MADFVRLECTGCGRENYYSWRNKRKNTKRIEKKKYCPAERRHIVHKETK